MLDNVWEQIPGSPEWHRRHDGILSLYVGPRGAANKECAMFPPEFTCRWTIWFFGALLGEGATPTPASAMSAAEQEADRVQFKIRERVKAMDIRNPGNAALRVRQIGQS
jgi:hypothetical protein